MAPRGRHDVGFAARGSGDGPHVRRAVPSEENGRVAAPPARNGLIDQLVGLYDGVLLLFGLLVLGCLFFSSSKRVAPVSGGCSLFLSGL